MDLAIKLIVFLPLVAAAIAGLFCRVIGARPAQIVTCAALLIAAATEAIKIVERERIMDVVCLELDGPRDLSRRSVGRAAGRPQDGAVAG